MKKIDPRFLGFDNYQEEALGTCLGASFRLDYLTLGLNGEAGEVAEKIKKIIRDDNGKMTEEKREAIKKELGDVLWYVAILAKKIGYDLSEVARDNIDKLYSRKLRDKINGDGDNR